MTSFSHSKLGCFETCFAAYGNTGKKLNIKADYKIDNIEELIEVVKDGRK